MALPQAVAQRRAEPPEHAGVDEEGALLVGQLVEHVAREVLADELGAGGQCGHRPAPLAGVLAPGGQVEQLQARRPSPPGPGPGGPGRPAAGVRRRRRRTAARPPRTGSAGRRARSRRARPRPAGATGSSRVPAGRSPPPPATAAPAPPAARARPRRACPPPRAGRPAPAPPAQPSPAPAPRPPARRTTRPLPRASRAKGPRRPGPGPGGRAAWPRAGPRRRAGTRRWARSGPPCTGPAAWSCRIRPVRSRGPAGGRRPRPATGAAAPGTGPAPGAASCVPSARRPEAHLGRPRGREFRLVTPCRLRAGPSRGLPPGRQTIPNLCAKEFGVLVAPDAGNLSKGATPTRRHR